MSRERFWFPWVGKLALLLFSTAFSLSIAEIITRIYFGGPIRDDSAFKRVMFFEEGKNFKNVDKIWTYYPNINIRSETYYVVNEEPVREYSYQIETNNLGLVQRKDISPGEVTDFIVGDSFTEGQGAIPWFYGLESSASLNKKTIVNGGLIGTGPLQWEMLLHHIRDSGRLDIRRANVIMIGGDIVRPVWNFQDATLTCLKNGECDDNLMGFWGYNFAGKSENKIANDALLYFEKFNDRMRTLFDKGGIGVSYKKLATKSAFLYQLQKTYERYQGDKNLNNGLEVPLDLVDRNLMAIDRLLTAGREKGFLLMLPRKDEAVTAGEPKWEKISVKAMEWFRSHNIAINICVLAPSDYHVHDGHPNSSGYEKIRLCVERLILAESIH